MTVSQNSRRAGPFTGDGSASTFPFTFTTQLATDIAVYTRVAGVESLLTLNTDYTVSLNADQNASPGGSVTTSSPLIAGGELVIIGARVAAQAVAIQTAGSFPPRVAEAAQDNAVILAQQLEEILSRAIVKSPTDPTDLDELLTRTKNATGLAPQIEVGGSAVGTPDTLLTLNFTGTGLSFTFDSGTGVGTITITGGGIGVKGLWDASGGVHPVGAADGDWYQVSVGGTYGGKTLSANQYVMFYDSLTKVLVVEVPGLVAAHVAASDPHGDRAFATSAVATHTAASDPHGDRAFATAADATHVAASDPHGDRAFATSAIATHTAASDPHGDRAFATSAIATHTAASDPHGDRAYADSAIATALVSVLKDRGNHDASGNTFPSTGGSGAAGAIKKGDLWYISVAGTLGGTAVNIGDNIRALVDAPGQTAGNWAQIESNIGYVPFNAANVDADFSLSANSNSKVPSQAAVKWYSDFPKSGTWRMLDSTDTTKKLALDLSAISTATTRTLTMPNASVSLGYVPTGFAVSGGIATMTGASGSYTLSFSVYDPAAIVTSSGINLVAGRVYRCSDDTSSYTINLPATPAEGDWVVIKDTPLPKNSRIGSGVGTITLNGGTKNVIGPDGYSVAPTVQITGSNVPGCERFTYLYAYASSANTWYFVNLTPNTQYLSPYARVLANPYLGLSGAYTAIVNYATANRTLSLPDYNIDLASYNTIPAINTANGNVNPGGTTSAILAGASNKANKSNQAVLAGKLINSSGLCPEDAALFGNSSVSYSASKVTGYVGSLKGSSTGTAASSLVTSSNTKLPAYLTKPSGHHAVSIFEMALSHTTSAGKVWYGKRRVCVRWDGTTATLDTQTVGTDWNPDTQTITFTPAVSSGLLDISMANTTAAGGDTCYWQCTYEAHHNGG